MSHTSKANTAAPAQHDTPIEKLLQIMQALRAPETGCPWDIEQSFETIAPYTVEEAYEVADAIARGDMKDLQEELGDLLLQVVFHAQMAAEKGLFTFDDVAKGIAEKLIYRHPHVFGDATAETAADVIPLWNARKEAEQKAKGKKGGLSEEGKGLPALIRAQKMRRKMPESQKQSHDTLLNNARMALNTEKPSPAALVGCLWEVAQLLEEQGVDSETALQAMLNAQS